MDKVNLKTQNIFIKEDFNMAKNKEKEHWSKNS